MRVVMRAVRLPLPEGGAGRRGDGLFHNEVGTHDRPVALVPTHVLIGSFVAYYNGDRTHFGVGKDYPCGRPVEQRLGANSNVVSLPRVGGPHHRYAWRGAV